MFSLLKDKLKKSIEKLTKKVEEKVEVEPQIAEEAKVLIEEKLEHIEPVPETKEPRKRKGVKAAEPEVLPEQPILQPKPLPEPELPVEVKPEIKHEEPKLKSFSDKIAGLFKPKQEVRVEVKPDEHHHKELQAKEKERVKKRVISITKKLLTDAEMDDVLWDLQVGLLENDVAVETAEKICARIKQDLSGEVVKRGSVEDVIKESFAEAVREVLGKEEDLIRDIKKSEKPYKIIILGFNGAGKTTTIARLARLLEKQGLTSVLAAGDTWRAAAIQQLEKHGDALGMRVVKHDYGSDAAAVIYDAVKYAETNKIDVVLADTAGRAHTNKNLMDELHKIMRVVKPQKKILIVDSLTGNDAVEQARAFESTVGVDGIILTKMDVNEKGGAALSVAHTIGKPIYFMGVGQNYDDLEPFHPEKIAKALLT